LRVVGTKMPPFLRTGMYAAYKADFELMFKDSTLGRGDAAIAGLLGVSTSAMTPQEVRKAAW